MQNAEALREGEGLLARGNYKLAEIYAARGEKAESEIYKTRALELRNRLRPEKKDLPFTEESFDGLCPYMVW